MPVGGLWTLELNSDARLYSDDFADFVSTDTQADGDQPSALVSIAPYSVLIYSLTHS
jgi:1,4-alpha-glucan branching enzyme